MRRFFNQHTPTSCKHFQTSMGIPYGPMAFPIFILFNAFFTLVVQILWTNLRSLSSIGSPKSLQSFILFPWKSLSIYLFHLSLILYLSHPNSLNKPKVSILHWTTQITWIFHIVSIKKFIKITFPSLFNFLFFY